MSFELDIQDIPHYTYKDYAKWEGDWELIKGIPYSMAPAPSWQHQHFGSEFINTFKNELKRKAQSCLCKVLYECDWIVNEDTVVRPDIMITCDKLEGSYPSKPPVLIVEILSPGTILKDRNTKFKLYESYGVKYYLIADADQKEIEFYQLQDNRYKQFDNITSWQFTHNCIADANLMQMIKDMQ